MNPFREEELSDLEKELQVEYSTEKDSRNLFRKLTDFYFMPKSFEKSGKLYERLGVRHFKKLTAETMRKFSRKLTGSYRAKGWNNYLIWDFSEKGLRAFDNATRINEASHSPFTVWLAYRTIDDLADGNYVGATIKRGRKYYQWLRCYDSEV